MELIKDLTLNNPIFITVVILLIWFMPGIIFRKFADQKSNLIKKKIQEEKISRLYPK